MQIIYNSCSKRKHLHCNIKVEVNTPNPFRQNIREGRYWKFFSNEKFVKQKIYDNCSSANLKLQFQVEVNTPNPSQTTYPWRTKLAIH